MFIVKDDIKKLTGSEKAAILFLCLSKEQVAGLMREMDESEIYSVTHAMAGLGTVTSQVVESVLHEFMDNLKSGAGLIGNFEAAESLLSSFMGPDKVREIMSEVRGPLMGKNMWDRFSSLNENVIATYLRGEYPQTVAAILSKVNPDVTSKVLPLLPNDLMFDVIDRMINMESIPRDILQDIEETLQKEFIASATRASTSDPYQKMAEVFNKIDPEVFEKVAKQLESNIPDEFQKIKQKMFTFDDLIRLDAQSLGRVMRAVEGNSLALALKGAKKNVRAIFLESMPERSRNILTEEMQSMGPVRMREVQDAQTALVFAAKELAAEGVITLPMGDEDDTIIE